MEKIKVGVIGCGNISGVYLQNMPTFEILEVAACADAIPERAQAQGAKYGVPSVTVEELLADQEIQIVVDLTPPMAHMDVALQALRAGKSVYNEKPLGVSREQGQEIIMHASERGLQVGCAPDTFLGAGLQTCRRLIDEGAIGQPVAAAAFMLGRGPEAWHPDPEFFYKPGAGPLFDVGPYYLTALVNLLGPVRRLTSSARISFPERVVGSGEKRGQNIQVETPTHLAGVLDFQSGVVGTLITSFDVWQHSLPRIEVYGSEGTLRVPDPNTFGGPVEVWRAETKAWENLPLDAGYTENMRGLGVADLAHAMRSGRQPRASGELAYHVLDIMQSIIEASERGVHIELESRMPRPEPLPTGLRPGVLD